MACVCLTPVAAFSATRVDNTVLVVRVGFYESITYDRHNAVVWPECDSACVRRVLWTDDFAVGRVLAESSAGRFALTEAGAHVVDVVIPVVVLSGGCGMECSWRALATTELAVKGVSASLFSVRMWLYPFAAGGNTCVRLAASTHHCNATGPCDMCFRRFDVSTVLSEVGNVIGFGQRDGSDPIALGASWRLYAAPHRMRAGWQSSLVMHTVDWTMPVQAEFRLLTPDTVLVGQVPAAVGGGQVVVQWRSTFVSTTDGLLDPEWADAVYVHWMRGDGTITFVAKLRAGQTLAGPVFPGSAVFVSALAIGMGMGNVSVVGIGPCIHRPPVLVVDGLMVTLVNNDVLCPPRTFTATAVSLSPTGHAQPSPFRCMNLTIAIVADSVPREIGVFVTTADGHKLLAVLIGSVHTPVDPVYTVLHCAKGAREVMLVEFLDSSGDGYCCGWGMGSFAVWANGVLVARGGVFGSRTTVAVTCAWQW